MAYTAREGNSRQALAYRTCPTLNLELRIVNFRDIKLKMSEWVTVRIRRNLALFWWCNLSVDTICILWGYMYICLYISAMFVTRFKVTVMEQRSATLMCCHFCLCAVLPKLNTWQHPIQGLTVASKASQPVNKRLLLKQTLVRNFPLTCNIGNANYSEKQIFLQIICEYLHWNFVFNRWSFLKTQSIDKPLISFGKRSSNMEPDSQAST